MSRTKGAKNIPPFETRSEVATSPNSEIRHLASSANQTVLEYFLDLLRHQSNYARWIRTRHDDLKQAKDELARLKSSESTGPKDAGPKDATYRKYKWYSEYLVLLEAINAYEVFYKRTLIRLAEAIRDYVPADRLKGSIDARILWSAPRKNTLVGTTRYASCGSHIRASAVPRPRQHRQSHRSAHSGKAVHQELTTSRPPNYCPLATSGLLTV